MHGATIRFIILYILTFYYTICITHFTRQMIKFYVSHFETNDLILMYSMDVNTMESQSVHSVLWLNWQK